MDPRREAFLAEIQADLDSSARTQPGRAQKLATKIGIAGSVAAASVGLLAAPAGASPTPKHKGGGVHAAACSRPDAVPRDQSKWCGTQNYYFKYLRASPGPGHTCYVFYLTIFHAACGGTVRVGEEEACN